MRVCAGININTPRPPYPVMLRHPTHNSLFLLPAQIRAQVSRVHMRPRKRGKLVSGPEVEDEESGQSCSVPLR